MTDRAPSGLIASFQDHYSDLLRFLARRTGNVDRATDVAQDTYLRLATVSDDAAGIENQRAYIYRVAGNLAIDSLRRDGRNASWLIDSEPGADIADPTPSVERALIARDRLARIEDALSELPPNPRLALLMFRIDGLSHREIAERLGVSESMVAKYIGQALRHCRDRLWRLD